MAYNYLQTSQTPINGLLFPVQVAQGNFPRSGKITVEATAAPACSACHAKTPYE